MCDICVNVYKELKPAVEAALEKFPGTTVGKDTVTRQHHVISALMYLAKEKLQEEQLENMPLGNVA